MHWKAISQNNSRIVAYLLYKSLYPASKSLPLCRLLSLSIPTALRMQILSQTIYFYEVKHLVWYTRSIITCQNNDQRPKYLPLVDMGS